MPDLFMLLLWCTMNLRTSTIPVYPITVFEGASQTFWIGRLEKLSERYSFMERPHRLTCYTLLFIENAEGMVHIDQSEIELDAPRVICIKPDSVFTIELSRSGRGTIICFTESFFSLRYNSNVLYQFEWLKQSAEYHIRLSDEQIDKWKTMMGFINDEMCHYQESSEKVIRSFLNILLFEFDRNFKKTENASKVSIGEEKVIQFEKLIEENFLCEKTPSWYAIQLHITANYLNKLSQTYRGMASGELIRKRVTIEAQRLLYYTSLSVAEVAYELGFESASYFITFFKKNTGLTPESFRSKK